MKSPGSSSACLVTLVDPRGSPARARGRLRDQATATHPEARTPPPRPAPRREPDRRWRRRADAARRRRVRRCAANAGRRGGPAAPGPQRAPGVAGSSAADSSSRSATSSRARSVWRARIGTTSRSAMSSSSGSNSCRTRLRRNAECGWWVLDRPQPQGLAQGPGLTPAQAAQRAAPGSMPARPSRPAPRSRLSSIVSAWSSAVCRSAPAGRAA